MIEISMERSNNRLTGQFSMNLTITSPIPLLIIYHRTEIKMDKSISIMITTTLKVVTGEKPFSR
jgi:hypothetical protein